jgi:predicted nucleic acid-binding protein
MPGRYLLDTNAVIDLFAQNEELAAKLEAAETVTQHCGWPDEEKRIRE